MPNGYSVLGIRHHGPGSARSVRQALEQLQPDVILVEGPPDAAEILPLADHAGMKPPVALLIYVPAEPKRAVYYPFAIFSPEWQSIQYGLSHNIPVRFMDLPQAHQFALTEAPGPNPQTPTLDPQPPTLHHDPLRWMAEAAGYSDGERWWEHMVEQRRNSTDLFEAILELMTSLREEFIREAGPPTNLVEVLREVYMRQTIRAAQQEGYQRIAVICGAWHAPALATLPPAKEDAEQLKRLPKVKVVATWVPWTYNRLTYWSGYGAGIQSPGYYHHLWSTPDNVTVQWLTRVAQLLRKQDLDASTANVIEAVRLAESLAAVRDRPLAGLPELTEAVRAVFCFGDDRPLQLIGEKLIVGEALGEVPEETPLLPLLQDLQREQKRLRLPPEATQRLLDLDLRKPTELERSRLLHRLNLLGIHWGQAEQASGGKGTFHELWRLQWQPELAVSLIEANVWGNTILDAAAAYTRHTAEQTTELPVLTRLVERALLADLPEAISQVMLCLQNVAALTSDVPHLMDALPPLANVLRYGNVRQTDTSMVRRVVDGLIVRICIGLPAACATLNDEAAQAMFERLINVHRTMTMLQNEAHLVEWRSVLLHLTDQAGLHGLLAGRCCRLLFDQAMLPADEVARRMGLALSPANEPSQAAAWLEGSLHGSGLLLLHNDALWQILDAWVVSLQTDTFVQLLPLLRRTFATFSTPERRQMGERVKRGSGVRGQGPGIGDQAEVDVMRANKVLPLAAQLLRFKWEETL
jgi:hypothetical protein